MGWNPSTLTVGNHGSLFSSPLSRLRILALLPLLVLALSLCSSSFIFLSNSPFYPLFSPGVRQEKERGSALLERDRD